MKPQFANLKDFYFDYVIVDNELQLFLDVQPDVVNWPNPNLWFLN